MHRGYIKLHRKVQENVFYRECRVFSKFEAWVDILLEIQHSKKPQQVIIKNKILTCNRGESLNSIGTWAKRWKWSNSKVSRFLDVLKRCDQIRTKNESVTNRLSVCNYDKYNDERIASESQVNRKRIANESQAVTDKNVKNDKNDKNDKYSVEMAENIYNAYPRKKGKKAAIKSIIKSLHEVEYETLLDRVHVFAKSVTGSDPKYIKHPATWFNQGCWDDEDMKSSSNKIEATPVRDLSCASPIDLNMLRKEL